MRSFFLSWCLVLSLLCGGVAHSQVVVVNSYAVATPLTPTKETTSTATWLVDNADFNTGTTAGDVSRITDDDTSTFINSRNNTNDKWVRVDFGTAKQVSHIILSSRNNNGTRLNGVNIELSNTAPDVEDTSWAVVDQSTGTSFTGTGIETIQFNISDTGSYRYIRIFKPQDPGNNVNLDLSEFEVYTY